jgi:DNA-directed RNA polymerase specialized sigma subunit
MITKPRAKKHYVNNKTLYEEMVKYRQNVRQAEAEGKTKPIIPRYIGECLLMICTKLSTKPNFASYTYRDDMVADGVENCIASVDNFDPDKSVNPFAYFTQIAWNAFIRRITKEKKQSYIKHKNFENSFMMRELEDEMSSHGIKRNEYSEDIIRSFEEKNKLTKTPKKYKVKSGVEKYVSEE